MMKRIKESEVPEKPEVRKCKSHGDYEVKYADPIFGNVYVLDYCTKCSKEKNDEEARQEEIKKEQENIDRRKIRLENAGLSVRLSEKTFDDFSVNSKGQERAKRLSIALRDDILNSKRTGSIIMNGGVGTGKTALCSSIVASLVDTHRVKLIKAIDLIRHLKSSWVKGCSSSEMDLINFYSKLDLLIIDEIGMQFGSDTEKMFIFDVIDGRYNEMLPTVLISNLGIDAIKKLIGERVIDRLREDGGQLISFDWESHRK